MNGCNLSSIQSPMVAFFTRAPGSICHHLQVLHTPHFECFMAISPFEAVVSHNSADQEVAFIHREASNVAAATQLVPMNEIVGALSPLMKQNPRSPATRV